LQALNKKLEGISIRKTAGINRNTQQKKNIPQKLNRAETINPNEITKFKTAILPKNYTDYNRILIIMTHSEII